MDGFKNSTKTHYYKGGEVAKYNTGGRVYGPSADPAPPPQADNRHRLGSLGDAPSAPTSGGASVSVGRVGRGVTGSIPGSKTAGKGYGGTARVPFAKGGQAKGAAKIAKVMGEFKRGELHSGSKKGPEVKNPKQAVAIALSEAGKSKPVKKAEGGRMVDLNRGGMPREGVSSRPVKVGMTPEEMAAARGNRMQGLEAREEAKLMREARESRKVTPRTREAVSERRTVQQRDVREPMIRNPLMDKLTTLPSQRGEMPMRRKGGGLAVMPGKKGC